MNNKSKYSEKESLARESLMALGKISGKSSLHLQEKLQTYDLTPQQFNLLRILRGAKDENLNSKIIRERLIDKNADVSRLITRLVDKNFIHLVPSVEDKRQRWVKLTDTGFELLTTVDKDLPGFPFDFLDNLKVDDMQTLIEILNKI
jgi:MarR family 2-MHQ and catechol resistance regulon transcriptional repressor